MGADQAWLPNVPPPLPPPPAPGASGDGPAGEPRRDAVPRLKAIDRQQMLLRPVPVEALIAEDHPARAIWDFVGRLDLTRYREQIDSVEGSAGRPAFDPQRLVPLGLPLQPRGEFGSRDRAAL